MDSLNLDFVLGLYHKYADSLRAARDAQRVLLETNQPPLNPKLDDIEAEITYLRIREFQPQSVMELGSFHGWSTTWLLRALRDNGSGHLYTYDLVDHVVRSVPKDLSGDRWTFVHGNIQEKLDDLPKFDYAFIDADHSAKFARWYVPNLIPRFPDGIPVSVHDVFHRKMPTIFHEGRVVLNWLAAEDMPYFTASRAKAPEINAAIQAVKKELGMDAPVHTGRDNPMIYFNLK